MFYTHYGPKPYSIPGRIGYQSRHWRDCLSPAMAHAGRRSGGGADWHADVWVRWAKLGDGGGGFFCVVVAAYALPRRRKARGVGRIREGWPARFPASDG